MSRPSWPLGVCVCCGFRLPLRPNGRCAGCAHHRTICHRNHGEDAAQDGDYFVLGERPNGQRLVLGSAATPEEADQLRALFSAQLEGYAAIVVEAALPETLGNQFLGECPRCRQRATLAGTGLCLDCEEEP